MGIYQRIRLIVRSQEEPHPEPGVVWIYKTDQQQEVEGELKEVFIIHLHEDGEWKQIATSVGGEIVPTGDVTKDDLAKLKEELEKEISDVEKSSLSATKEISWLELKNLRDTGNLTPGMHYRITDYVATTTQEDTRSANNPFDIIVEAITNNTLAEEARAAKNKNNGYFAGQRLESWKVWYSIDNNTNRFSWADVSNGKGVVYRLIDQYGNDLPYDFKGIQFKRYEIQSTTFSSFQPLVGLKIGMSFNQGIAINSSSYKWYYTFSWMGTTWDDPIRDGSFNAMASNVVFTSGEETDSNNVVSKLLNNIFVYGKVVSDFLCEQEGVSPTYSPGSFVSHVRFDGSACENNTFIGYCGLVTTGSTFRRNLIVGSFRHIDAGTNFQDNTLFNVKDFAFIRFGHNFHDNKIYSTQIFATDFGNYFMQNTASFDVASNSSFGNYFGRNTLTNVYFNSVVINGGQFTDCTFTGKYLSCTFNAICGYADFKGGPTGYKVTGLDVVGNIRGTSLARINVEGSDFVYEDSDKFTKRRIRLEGDANNNMIISWYYNGRLIKKTKGASGSTWTDLEDIIILTAPNNISYRVTVDNDGNLQTVPAIQ